MHSASAWTSILTGLDPGRHGLFVFNDRDSASGRQTFFRGGDRTGLTIGEHAKAFGLTSGFLNVPMTYPAQATEGGYVVSGLDAPSLNDSSFDPPELRKELLEKYPDYNFTPPGLGDLMSAGRVTEAIQSWLRLIEAQTSVAEYLLSSRPVDLFMTVYTASDWGGHNLWMDGLTGPLLSIYQALDAAITRLLANADEGTQVYVISDHGMGAHTGASYHLARWLEENELMRRRKASNAGASVMKAGKQAARKLLPAGVRGIVKSKLGEERVKRIQTAEKDEFYSSIDWSDTTLYTEPGRHVININLKGRNPNGIVNPSDRDALIEQLTTMLESWRDPSGTNVVERVVKREKVYQGPFVDRASDLYVYWNPNARLGDPPQEVLDRGFWWSGDHRLEGILICKGPGIAQSKLAVSPGVCDLVPTIFYLAGLPVPEGLDGRVIIEACASTFVEAHPLKMHATATASSSPPELLSSLEEEQIEEKLKGLGYM